MNIFSYGWNISIADRPLYRLIHKLKAVKRELIKWNKRNPNIKRRIEKLRKDCAVYKKKIEETNGDNIKLEFMTFKAKS